MRKYYRKDEQGLTITNLEIKESKIKNISFETTMLRKDVLYYEGILGTMYRFEDKNQVFSRDDAYDYLHRQIDNCIKNRMDVVSLINGKPVMYVDTQERFPISISKEEIKVLRKERKNRKKSKNKTR